PRSAGVAIPGIRRGGKRPRRGGQVFHGASPLLRLGGRGAPADCGPVVLQARTVGSQAGRRDGGGNARCAWPRCRDAGPGAGRPVSGQAQSAVLPASTAQALVTRGDGDFNATELTVRSEQSPFRESRITLTEDLDALGMPRVALDWRIAPEDDVRMRRAMVILARELGAAGLARTWIPGDASRFVW